MMTEEQHLQALCQEMNWDRATGERYVSLADGIHMAIGGVHPTLISRLVTTYSIRHDAR